MSDCTSTVYGAHSWVCHETLIFRVRLIVQRQPSRAINLTTYYESIQATENFPPYAALDMAVTDNQVSAVSIGDEAAQQWNL